MSKYLGRVTIKVNGQVLDSKPGASIDLGGVMRESQVTDQGMGYTETPKPSRIECEMALKSGVSVDAFRNITDSTAVFECDTGQRFIIKNAFTGDTISVASGAVKLALIGEPAQEMVS